MGIMAKQDHVRSQSHQLWSLSGLGLDGSSLFFCDAVSCGLAWLLLVVGLSLCVELFGSDYI